MTIFLTRLIRYDILYAANTDYKRLDRLNVSAIYGATFDPFNINLII
jgi:hypothetical protein